MSDVTAFDLECLRRLHQTGIVPPGKDRIAFVSALRRLEKRGLTAKGRRWCVTSAGRRMIE